jgi:hypothetical protein
MRSFNVMSGLQKRKQPSGPGCRHQNGDAAQ